MLHYVSPLNKLMTLKPKFLFFLFSRLDLHLSLSKSLGVLHNFLSILGYFEIPKGNKHWNHKAVVTCLHSQQHWVEQHELLFMDERNSHNEDDENHCLH